MIDFASMQKELRPFLIDITLLSLLIGLLYFILLGVHPLFVPDEGRYAEIAREMADNNNYITPYLNGIKYFEKPPLFYWMSTLALKIGGINLWSLRTVNGILALLGCLATYFAALKLYDNRKTALWSAAILATSTLYFVMGHMISLDLPVSVFLAFSLYAFIIGYHQQQPVYFVIASAAAALAVLTKGLIGIVFPGLIISMWILLVNEWKILKEINYVAVISVFLVIAVPWHILVGFYNPEFYYFYFIKQHILRYATESIGHYQPIWFFIPVLFFGFFPWVIFLPQALSKKFNNKADIFLLVWIVSIFLFFSFSKSKLIPYILPIFPPLAILIARYFQNASSFSIKISINLLLMIATIISVLLIIFAMHTPLPNPKLALIFLGASAAILILGFAISYVLVYKNRIIAAINCMVIISGLFILSILGSLPAIDTRTILPLAQQLQVMLKEEDEIVSFNQYYQDLPFYLQRKVRILNWRNELRFGMLHQSNATTWLINDATFWQLWFSDKRVFVILAKDELTQLEKLYPQLSFHVIASTLKNVLMSNTEKH